MMCTINIFAYTSLPLLRLIGQELYSMQAEQNNQVLRSIRMKQFTRHQQQKQLYQGLFSKDKNPDFTHKQHRGLITGGVPSEYRAMVWHQLIPSHPGLSLQLFHQLSQQLAQMGQNSPDPNPQMALTVGSKVGLWLQLLKQDVPRTFPEAKLFHLEPEQDQRLYNVVGCFTLLRQDIGYIQGLSLIGCLLLQQFADEHRAFTALVYLATCTPLHGFFSFNQEAMSAAAERVTATIGQLDQKLHAHLVHVETDVRAVVTGWMMTLFARIFALDTLMQVWDVLFVGQLTHEILARLGAGVFVARREVLMSCEDGFEVVRQLKGTALSMAEEEEVLEILRKGLA